jgi:DNA-directed RNA polymerase subunit RPC12/RpoP
MGDEPLPVFVFGCMVCGKTVAGTEASCPRCGTSFENVRFECPFCGGLVSPTERRCNACGTEFGAFAEEVSETAVVDLDCSPDVPHGDPTPDKESCSEETEYECPNCGKPVSEDDVKCPHCGAVFS